MHAQYRLLTMRDSQLFKLSFDSPTLSSFSKNFHSEPEISILFIFKSFSHEHVVLAEMTHQYTSHFVCMSYLYILRLQKLPQIQLQFLKF